MNRSLIFNQNVFPLVNRMVFAPLWLFYVFCGCFWCRFGGNLKQFPLRPLRLCG